MREPVCKAETTRNLAGSRAALDRSGAKRVTAARSSWFGSHRCHLRAADAESTLVGVQDPLLHAPQVARHAPHYASDPFAAIFTADAGVSAAIAWSHRQLAASELPIMLLAETGSGKELFANAIHAASRRATRPLHAVNCGAIAPALLEAELFGYAPGAFTGAAPRGRAGLFHVAHGGTLFLDEVAEMPPAMQATLLRVLETGTFRRVGDTRLERSDVRVVCATCRDLPGLVATGAFRQDLYYRLKGAVVRIPALRERTDLLALAERLLGGDLELAPDAGAALAAHAWPGNVRELESVLATARRADRGRRASRLELAHLPPELAGARAGGEVGHRGSGARGARRCARPRRRQRQRGRAHPRRRARTTLRRMKQRHGIR